MTFLWVVAQALLTTPHNFTISYRDVFTEIARVSPKTGCISSIGLSTSQAAMLFYYTGRLTEPVFAASDAKCAFVLLQRYRDEPNPLPDLEYTLRFRGNRHGDKAEAFELYEKNEQVLTNPETAPKV